MTSRERSARTKFYAVTAAAALASLALVGTVGLKNDSKQKTYTSVTIKAPVASAEELYQCYAVLRQDPRVKIAL